MVNLTLKAADDITDYYYNVMLQYPNTWDVTDVMTQSDKVADAIWEKANRIIKRLSLVGGQVKSPLLKSLQANGMVEAYAESVGWQFTLRCDKSTNEYYVDNAIKGQNMSNRANRRGTSNPYAPLSDDDRENQTLMNCSKNKSKNVIRLTESMLKAIIAESVNGILKEITLEKDSYQAKPKNGGRLNDWELMHILTTIVSSMISDKRVSKEDGEMLLYYALYNNDCYTHADS